MKKTMIIPERSYYFNDSIIEEDNSKENDIDNEEVMIESIIINDSNKK